MLIQAIRRPCGSMRPDPIQQSPLPRTPAPCPTLSMKRQSAESWFQPASDERGMTASASWAPSGTIRRLASVGPIPDLVVGGLVERGGAARNPARGPFDHALQRYARWTELLHHAGGIIEPAGGV